MRLGTNNHTTIKVHSATGPHPITIVGWGQEATTCGMTISARLRNWHRL